MNDILIPAQGWVVTPQRIKIPVQKEQTILFNLIGKTSKWFGREEIPDVFKVLAINNRLFWAWLYFASRLMPYGKLSGREREIVILRVAWLCRCRYEWGQHIEIGLKNGLTDDDIIHISAGASAFQHEKEMALIMACDELMDQKFITDHTWQLLSRFYTAKMIVEISMLIGNYQMLAGFLNSSGLTLEPAAEVIIQAFNKRIKNKPQN